uniref:Si:dkey-103i16.6 n=1 Tax=Seriola lalandi dorsalis TaxID=1841481 RepID=A0A3B4XK32_SERLL
MNRSRTRITRSSSSQVRHPAESQDSGLAPYGKQRKKQPDSALAQDLSQMSVSGQDILRSSKGKTSKCSSNPVKDGESSGSRSAQSSPSVSAAKLPSRGSLASVARLVKLGRCKNVVVVAGAGISTASGIPDFRLTPGTGLYANLEKYNIPYPEAIFNIDYFSNDPQPFFSLAKALYPGSHQPNYIHYFIRMLHHKGLLLRMYTQNIDGLEKLCGIPDDKLVEAHGSFATASCHFNSLHLMPSNLMLCFLERTFRRSISSTQKTSPKQTSFLLSIEPFASLVNTVRSTVPRLLLNRHAVGPFEKVPLRRGDHIELGDLEDTVRRFAEMLGWNDEITELMRSQETASIPTLINGAPSVSGQTPFQGRGMSEPPGRMETSRSRPGGQRAASSGSEETDSETDSKSSASSNLSN